MTREPMTRAEFQAEQAQQESAADNSIFDSLFSSRHQAAQIAMRDVLVGDVVAPIHQALKQELEKK